MTHENLIALWGILSEGERDRLREGFKSHAAGEGGSNLDMWIIFRSIPEAIDAVTYFYLLTKKITEVENPGILGARVGAE